MNNKKINNIIAGSIIVILLVLFTTFIILNYSKDEKSLSIAEKKWLTDNVNNVIDVNIFNNIPIYGYNGSGISFSFLDSFTNKYNIKFNKISYYDDSMVNYKDVSFRVINPKEKITNEDILFYEDDYVVLAKEEVSLHSISNINFGILSDDEKTIEGYFNKDNYKVYNSVLELIDAVNNKDIDYVVVPSIKNTKWILENDFKIVYHVSDLSNKYVLRVKNKVLYNIMNKYYNIYQDDSFLGEYGKEYLYTYFNSTKTKDIDRKNYNGKIYKYGYVVNMPYEGYSNNNFVGTLSDYLSNFGKIINTEIEVVKFSSIDDLKNSLVNGDIDIALTNFDADKINMKNNKTQAFSNEYYVVLSKDNVNINSIKGLVDREVSVVGSSNLHSICVDNNIKTKVFKDTDDLIRNVNDNDLIMMDKMSYYYYKLDKLDSYHVIYEDRINDAYKFIVNEKDKTFLNLLNYYVSINDYRNIRYNYNTDVVIKDDQNNTRVAVVIVIVMVLIVVLAVIIHSKYANSKYLKREERLKFIDPMTSLKNRNYLNHNIYKWDDNVIYPQAIVMIDVNKIKKINDHYGREVGDEIIKKVAGILINSQLENTDIVRTGGDEFLIYMIGYEKEKVLDYIKKLNKEMKKINNSYGVEIGYSMILDQVKSVDDAINEAILMMEDNKSKDK